MVIRQFDLFSNPSRRTRDDAPYVVVLQSHYVGDLPTIVLAPVYRREAFEALTKLNVEVQIRGLPMVISIAELAAINATLLHVRSGSLVEHEDAIRRALDRLFTGF